MQIVVIKCPNCSGDITYAPGQQVTRCPYCDSMLNIKPGPDAVALERTKNEFKNSEHIRDDYGKRVRHWKIITYIYYGLELLLSFISLMLADRCRNHSDGYNLGKIILLMVFISFFAVPPLLSKMVPTPPKEVAETLRQRSGLLVAVRMAITAFLFALAGGLIAECVVEYIGPYHAGMG